MIIGHCTKYQLVFYRINVCNYFSEKTNCVVDSCSHRQYLSSKMDKEYILHNFPCTTINHALVNKKSDKRNTVCFIDLNTLTPIQLIELKSIMS